MLEPMQIDSFRFRKLTMAENKRRRREGLGLYCKEKGHDLGNWHYKPSTSKLHNFKFTSTNPKVEDELEDLEIDHVQP